MIIGHFKQRQYLKRLAEAGKCGHAYLFSGPAQLGKKKIALEWAHTLLKDAAEKEIHPDLVLIESVDGEIKIAQIRDLIWKLALKPQAAPLKVAILNDCHLMNQEAQNCFLKTLEEPKGDTLLILITEHPSALLPTIFSRCQEVRFYPVSEKEMAEHFKEEIIRAAVQRPGRAEDFSKNPEKLIAFQGALREIAKICQGSLAERFQYAQKISQSEDVSLIEVLEIWLFYFKSMLLASPKARNILAKIQEIHFLLSYTNANPRLALETIMLEI